MTTPALLSVTTLDNATIVLHFNTTMVAGAGDIVISDGYSQTYVGAGGLKSRIVGATDTHVVRYDDGRDYQGQDVVLHLDTPLKAGLTYSVTMAGNAVLGSGDVSAGAISSTTLFPFSVGSAAPVPAQPGAVIGAAIHFTDNGSNTSDYITSVVDQTVSGKITGTLGAHDFVQVSLDNGASWHVASVDGDNWSYSGAIDTANLAPGGGDIHSMLLARVSNTASQNSGTASHSYTLASGEPAASIDGAISFSNDSGSSATDHVTNAALQTISGTYQGALGSGEQVQISLDNGSSWTNAVAADGNWSAANINLHAGANELQVRVVNDFGASSESTFANYDLLSSAVSLEGHALTLPQASDHGTSNSDGITNAAPAALDLAVLGLRGLHAGDTIQIIDTSHADAVVGSYLIASGDLYYGKDYFSDDFYNPAERASVSIQLTALEGQADGGHILAARVVDLAGNISTVASDALDLRIDTQAPLLTSSTPGDGVGTVSAGITELVFNFNEQIAIDDGAVITIVDVDDPYSYQEITLSSSDISGARLTVHLNGALTNGTHYAVYGAAIADLAGNVGITGDDTLLHFTTSGSYPAPTAPVITLLDSAPESSAANAPDSSDGVSNDPLLRVEGVNQGQGNWYYRIGDGDSWHLGSGYSLTLQDGSYAAGEIQVKQTVHGVDSTVVSIGHAVTIDTQAFSSDTLTGNHFIERDTSITGALASAQKISDQIIEVTFDHGGSWQAATLDIAHASDDTHANWSLEADLTQAIEYGVRIADQAGNVTGTVYYLTSRDASYSHPEYSDIVLHAGGGIDYITVGDRANIDGGGGYGDVIHTGDDAVVSVGNDSVITTGNGNNLVSTGFGANITTGNGDDRIYVSTVDGATVNAGGGNDLLVSNSGVTNLTLENLHITNVETFNFAYAGANDLTINTAASVRSTGGNGTLTITANNASVSHIHLNGSVWSAGGMEGTYQNYHTSTGEILLIGQNIVVDTLVGSA